MGKEHQSAAAARARAARWNPEHTQAVNNLNSEPPSPFQRCEDAEPHDIIVIESDSCSECDYTGGVGVDGPLLTVITPQKTWIGRPT